MSDIDQIMWFVLSVDAIFIFAALCWVACAVAWTKYDNWKNPVYPQCDIDPRCHPAYFNGWIGNVKVRR